MNQNSKSSDPRVMLAHLMLQSTLRGVKAGGKATEDCKKLSDGIAQFPIDQQIASVNLSVIVQEDGFVIAGGVAGNIMAIRALLMMLEASVDDQEASKKKDRSDIGDDFLDLIMSGIMGELMKAGGSNSKPAAAESKDPKQAEADAHLNETFGDIKSPIVPVESPADCEDNK